jgi:trigger factor
VPKEKPLVTDKELKDVLESLRARMAEKKDSTKPAKTGDEVLIDFKGVNSQGKPIPGADGTDYPLLLGSKAFIPGFEENLEGLKTGDEKTFELTFPKDYGLKSLAGKKVKFTTKIKKVQEVAKPELNDEFAKKSGPFKTLSELKADVKKQLQMEKQREADRKHQEAVVRKVVEGSSADIPDSLLEKQADFLIEDLKRNLSYRSQDYKDFLAGEGKSEEDYKKQVVVPEATKQVKTSLILSEIAQKEQVAVTPEELEIRLQILKGQYKDPQMQAELDKPENQRDIASRMLSEKVVNLLTKD